MVRSKKATGKSERSRAWSRARKKKASSCDARPWGWLAALVILAVAALRLAVNAFELVPVHFDEGQYWAYGQELAWGHFSKPPLVGWMIHAVTWIGGDTTFALRIGSVAAHALVAACVHLTGARLFDGRTGFWAAAGYTAAPGASASAMIMTTDPVMMLGWAAALYTWVRAADVHPKAGDRVWWTILGLALGLALLAKYTALAFVGGALGYAIFSGRGRDWPGAALAVLVGFLVFLPNLLWQSAHDFATFGHVAEDAAPGDPSFNPDKLAEFLGAQLGVIGPVWFLAILAALAGSNGWRADWRMRLLAWQTFPLILAMLVVAFIHRAQPNWAAPAYVAGSILAARWLTARDWSWALKAQGAIGAAAAVMLYAAAWAYAGMAPDLPRAWDPFKKMRLSEPFCSAALAAFAEEGAEVLLSNDRRRLSECMFLGGLTFEDVTVWNPDILPENHHEMVATLTPGDERLMLLAVTHAPVAKAIAARFEDAREIETGAFETHKDQAYEYAIWAVRGLRGY